MPSSVSTTTVAAKAAAARAAAAARTTASAPVPVPVANTVTVAVSAHPASAAVVPADSADSADFFVPNSLRVPGGAQAPERPIAAHGGDRPADAVGRHRVIEVVRVCFGVIWLIDAGMKWSPTFANTFLSYVKGEESGQPGVVKSYLHGWVSLLSHQPHVFAHLVAASETAVGLCLVLGAFTNLACAGGALLSLLIWSTAEGIGGPYLAGSTDVGASIVYVVVFAALFAAGAGGWASVDRRLRRRFGRVCAPPVANLAAPPRWAVAAFAILAAGGLATGLFIAFADAPIKAMS